MARPFQASLERRFSHEPIVEERIAFAHEFKRRCLEKGWTLGKPIPPHNLPFPQEVRFGVRMTWAFGIMPRPYEMDWSLRADVLVRKGA